VLPESALANLDGVAHRGQYRYSTPRIAQGGLHHFSEAKPAIPLEQEHPSSEGTWDASRNQSSPWNQIEAQVGETGDAGVTWRRALAIHHHHFSAAGLVKQDRHLSAKAIHVWLGHLQNQSGRHRGIECISPALQYGHSTRGG
jgi:hypothetical protein